LVSQFTAFGRIFCSKYAKFAVYATAGDDEELLKNAGICKPREHYMVVSDKTRKDLEAMRDLLVLDRSILDNLRTPGDFERRNKFCDVFPPFMIKTPAFRRTELRQWMKTHIHFVTYKHDDQHSKLVDLVNELSKCASKAEVELEAAKRC